jgi:simple sugar transport system ATP-binding protein
MVPAVELIAVTKAFPGVLANDDVSLTVQKGEVHCLLGENGAGKSTLISILSGMLRPDSGRIRVHGAEVRIRSPRDALQLGIGTVYQHSTLIPALTVLENLMLGQRHGLLLDASGVRKRLAEMASVLGVEVDPDVPAGDLALGRQQQVEIMNALWRGSSVLILDEPTSMLTPQGVQELQKVLRRISTQGVTTIFITHKLHEALAVSDSVTILRRGRAVGTLDKAQLGSQTAEQLQASIIAMMFGDETRALDDVAELKADVGEAAALLTAPPVSPDTDVADTLLELKSVSAAGGVTDPGISGVSFAVHSGEIFGVAGVDGNGQRALAEAIAGLRPVSAGTIELFGAPITTLRVAARQKLGLGYVTDDRLGEGVVRSISVSLNLFLKRIGQAPFWRRGRIDRALINREAQRLVDSYQIRTADVESRAGTLSGGNTQKLLLARELAFGPKVVVFNKPTYGLDIRTTQHVRDQIRAMVAGGAAAVVISTDIDELMALCRRIAVLSRGELVGVVQSNPKAAEQIGALMIGAGPDREAA